MSNKIYSSGLPGREQVAKGENNTKKDIENIEEKFNSVKKLTVEQKVVNSKKELKIFLNKEWLKVVNNQTNWKKVFCILLYNITCHFELWTE